jgi:hypothetical protein
MTVSQELYPFAQILLGATPYTLTLHTLHPTPCTPHPTPDAGCSEVQKNPQLAGRGGLTLDALVLG